MKTERYSWGNLAGGTHKVVPLFFRDEDPFSRIAALSVLPFGTGRSYGDSCLNINQSLIEMRHLRRLISFDPESGVLQCEAGVTLGEVLQFSVPRGFFIPISLGTKLITVGGAIGNDVHGKNHHRAGTFGCHVRSFELLRSDGMRRTCSPTENGDLYRATIGGLGLTGIVLSAELQLKRIPSAYLKAETIPFRNIEEYFQLADESDEGFEHSSAWVDFTSAGERFGRGIFLRGNFEDSKAKNPFRTHRLPTTVPLTAPNWLLRRGGIRLFNEFYYRRSASKAGCAEIHYDPFFFPLDGVGQWNRLYGRRGFFQYQFVIPTQGVASAVQKVTSLLRSTSTPPFLAVVKSFGSIQSPGVLSFPMPGLTVALDFPNLGEPIEKLFQRLDEIVANEGGRIYPAKDARMSAEHFKTFFPMWQELANQVDPRFSSSFWRRVMGGASA